MASNTSLLDTDLSLPPYFDDSDPTKQYYKVLFKPATAIQARELNELQTTLQNQIASFGQNIFKEGSVIKGCNFTIDNNYQYVKLQDNFSGSTANLNVVDLIGYKVWNQNGLNALVVYAIQGYTANDPDLNTVYLKYLNTGTFPNNATQSVFAAGETLTFTNATTNSAFGNVIVSSLSNSVGTGYAFTTTEGIIFKKGYFIYVTPQTTLVSKYNNVPDLVSIGFDANETLVDSSVDLDLLDNAGGSPNENAPGADRLKLTPNLVVRPTSQANQTGFFSIADFRNGAPITIRQDTQFNSIATENAKRTFETNGNFVVNPFIVTTQSLANTSDPDYSNHFNALVGKGLGYVEGYRVQYLNQNLIKVRKGTDTNSVFGQVVSANFGYYVLAQELCGQFGDSSSIIKVDLHNVAKTSISSGTYLGAYETTTKIGTAYLRGVAFDNGSQGSPTAQYRMYLFDINMSPGANFSDVRSITYYVSGGTFSAVADVVLTKNFTSGANVASLYDVNLNQMIYQFGQNAIKPDGFDNTSFAYRKITSASFPSNSGVMSVALPATSGTGTESFLYTGNYSSTEENSVIVVPTSTTYSNTKAGTAQIFSVNTLVSGTLTSFLSDYSVGDLIYINGSTRVINNISNNTSLNVSTPFSANATAQTHQRAYVAGVPIPFGSRTNKTISVSGNTMTLSLGETLTNDLQATVAYTIERSSTVAAKKTLISNVFVKIDCSNNSANSIGPWCLGVSDVYRIDGVYIDNTGGGTYSNTGANMANSFVLDNGQRDAYYDLAYITAQTGTPITPNTTILVQLTKFAANTSQGVGFFTANSYPIDDVNVSNTSAIMTKDIPTYTSSDGSFYDLRNCVDFRPYASNTANVATSIAGATVNPSYNLQFNYTPYLVSPDSIFQTDLQYYLGRTDRLAIDINGFLVNDEGIPSVSKPKAPIERSRTMTLALLKIPPYPSLATDEAKKYNRYDIAIQAQTNQNRRYTMKDISGFDKRISNLEYYTSLSLLESSASTLQIRSSTTGQTRFQNGIFVDPFNGFDLSNTKHPKFYISIDQNKSELRPATTQLKSEFIFDPTLSTGVVQTGQLVMLEHTSNNVYIQQNYASKYRNCIEGNIYHWKGTIILTPSGSTSPDTTTSPDVTNNIDLAQNWTNLKNAWGTQWGNWDTVSTTYANTLISASNTVSQHVTQNGQAGTLNTTTTQTLQTTESIQKQIGTQLTTSDYNQQYNLGNFVTNVGILPYIPSATIQFSAYGLKPNTRLYAYFDKTPVNAWCAPTLPGYNQDSIEGLTKTSPYGTPLVSDSKGRVSGIFRIPPNQFKSQEITFELNDISNLEQGSSAITTQADGVYYGSTLTVANGSSKLNTRQTVLSSTEVSQQQKVQGTSVATSITQQFVPDPPRGGGGGSGCGCKIICTKLYELGLMDEETFKADQEFGEILRATDPDTYNGYVRWASIVVDWMSGNTPNVLFWIRDPEARRKKELDWTLKITHRIATPWAQHMQYLMGKRETDNFAGKLIMSVGKPVSKLVAKLPKFNNEKIGPITKYSMLGLFFALYSVSKIFGGKFGFPEPINK